MGLRYRTRILWAHKISDLQQKVNDFLDRMGRDIKIEDIKFQAEPETGNYEPGYSALVWYSYEDDREEAEAD